jgi:uracil-DNA glycosylase
MKKGLFSPLELAASKVPTPRIPLCGTCKAYRNGCQSPKMPVDGKGKKGILIIGEAPGKQEDEQGIPFVGPSGILLRNTLEKFDIDLRQDCWITNALICRPQKDSNKILNENMIYWCRPNAINTINTLKPTTIILLGAHAVKSILGWLWHESVGSISRWDGWKIPSQRLNAWICPTWHPAAMLHENVDGDMKQNEVRQLFFENHLKEACQLSSRPWKELPHYEKRVHCIIDPTEAARKILEAIGEEPIAFDYETTTLKPDSSVADIVCCSISNGKVSYAYPWVGPTIKAMRKFLESNTPKIGYNCRFEGRYTWKLLGCDIRNWIWDGMQAAHILDCRREISGLKFQAFVRLGVEPWEQDVKPYLHSNGSNTCNRVKEVYLPKLLEYCGKDSLYEYLVAKQQMKEMKR